MRLLPAAILLLCACTASAATLEEVGGCAMPVSWKGRPLGGLSGLTRVAGDLYYAVRDDGSRGGLFTLRVGVDRATGCATNCEILAEVKLKGRDDLEDVAWDAAARRVWACDEHDGSIRAFAPDSGEELARVDVPKVFDAYVFNRSFESLSIRADGREMWTCNEEALNRWAAMGRTKHRVVPVAPDTPDVDDGPLSTREHGSLVRLQKFTRTDPGAPWTPAGQWAYLTDPVGGKAFLDKSRSGVSDVLCLDDGRLLVLEREMSVKKGGLPVPTFRCRIYAVDFAGAPDTSGRLSLKDPGLRPVAKTRLFGARTGFAMYEGMCLGPVLDDGARSVLLIADGDDGAANRILALKLR